MKKCSICDLSIKEETTTCPQCGWELKLFIRMSPEDEAQYKAQLEKARQAWQLKKEQKERAENKDEKKRKIKLRLSPFKPLDYLRFLLWLLVMPQKLKAYKEKFGENDVKRMSNWLSSNLVIFPLLLLVPLSFFLQLPPLFSPFEPQPFPLFQVLSLLIGFWFLTGWLGNHSGKVVYGMSFAIAYSFFVIIIIVLIDIFIPTDINTYIFIIGIFIFVAGIIVAVSVNGVMKDIHMNHVVNDVLVGVAIGFTLSLADRLTKLNNIRKQKGKY